MSIKNNGDWPFVVLVLGILGFVATMVALGYPQALWALIILLVLFFL
jgi:hypothetical protein